VKTKRPFLSTSALIIRNNVPVHHHHPLSIIHHPLSIIHHPSSIIMGRRCFSGALAEKNGLAVDRYPLTKEEIQKAEDALAADLEKLSFVDQEKLLFDIHGLAIDDDDEEQDGKLDEKLKTVEYELKEIDAEKKSAYEQARYLNPEYVQGREFLLMFLRCTEYDPALAADQIVQHFETKRKLFGSGNNNNNYLLGRPVLLSDLPAGAVECLESGFCQLLPSRDVAGRVVMFIAPGYAKYDTMENMVRDALELIRSACSTMNY
jgi:hypothetical protein